MPHTPGPWTVGISDGGQLAYVGCGPGLAEVLLVLPGEERPTQTDLANLALAAAAPNLLAACKMVRDWWSAHQGDSHRDPPEFVPAALAAIAKAESP